jgi:hypothetical protein
MVLLSVIVEQSNIEQIFIIFMVIIYEAHINEWIREQMVAHCKVIQIQKIV